MWFLQGEWKPKQIDNPDYKGPWVHPEIANPEYTPDPELYRKDEVCAIGFDLWQVKSGTIFDNVLVTDDIDYAAKFGTDVWKPTIVSFNLHKSTQLKIKLIENDVKSSSDYNERYKSWNSSLLNMFQMQTII